MTTSQLSLFEKPQPVKKAPVRRMPRRSRKFFHEDNRNLPWHCDDCGTDLSSGVSRVLDGGTRKAKHVCFKCYETRKGLRDKHGRLVAA